jgi:hypothetical protein
MYTLYLALGHVAHWIRADLTTTYHLARLACGLLVLLSAGWWASTLFQSRSARRSAWILVAFSSGLGWLLALIPSAEWQARLVDLRAPEASTFLAAFTAPHFALGIALEALALLAFWRACVSRRWIGWAAASGLAALGLGLVYPFTLPVVYATAGCYVLWSFWRNGRARGKRTLAVSLIVAIIPLPFVLYYAQTFFFDPFWKTTHVAQNVIPTPGPLWLIAGYGLPLAFAAWGLVLAWKGRSEPWVLIGLWVTLNGLLLYLPLPFRWRLANGWHFALALLAALGLERGAVPRLSQWVSGTHRVRWDTGSTDTLRRVLLILTVPSTLMVALLGVRIAQMQPGFPYYGPRDELRAMDWLAEHVDFQDVVLAAYPTGNVLPTRALCRTVVGQQFTTLDPMEKLASLASFYDAETSSAERQAILERYGVTIVYHGRWERAMGDFDPDRAAYLREIHRDGEIAIYRVKDPQSREAMIP